MGYYHGYANYQDWHYYNCHPIACISCGKEFHPQSPKQKSCPYEFNPPCFNERELAAMSKDK